MVLPAMKNNVPWFTYGDAVHFRLSGELTSFEDPDGRVAALLRLLDGSRTVEEIGRALANQYPDVTMGDVEEALAELDSERLIQDATDTGADFTVLELDGGTATSGSWRPTRRSAAPSSSSSGASRRPS